MVFSRLARPAKLSALLILPFTLLAACAHTPHLPGQSHGTIHETIDFYAGEHTALVVSEGEFIAADKNTLSFTHYRPETGANGVAVVYFHGIESHGAWFEGPSSLLAEQGYDVYALDRRGSGRNQSGRGFTPGYAEDYEQLLSDIDEFLKTIDGRHRRVVLAGSSWAASWRWPMHWSIPGRKWRTR